MVNAFMESQAEWIIARIAVVARHAMNTPKVPSYKESKELARTIITNRVMHFAPLYGKEIKKITIRNQKTRWGSCSSNGTLSFNYHLLFVTPELRDYVVVHEICHIMAPNHSPKFWKLVAEKMPNYKMLRAELKNHAFNYE
jgi:predicted metal-dependent hydrolase